MTHQFEIALIVDQSSERALLKLVLTEAFPGASIVEISKPIELVEFLDAGRCDVAVVDRAMPWGEGQRLLHTLKAKFPGCSLVLVTADPVRRFGAAEVQMQIDALLGKDAAGLMELGPAIRAIRRREALRHSSNTMQPEAPRWADVETRSPVLVASAPEPGGVAALRAEKHTREAGPPQVPGDAAVALGPDERELEQLAYAVSHDLQEPLQQMARGIGQLFEAVGDSPDDTSAKTLRRLDRNVAQLQRMVDGVLAYSRIGTRFQSEEKVDLNLVLEDVMAGLHSVVNQAGARISIDEPLPILAGDRQLLTQLLQNLVSNALKFCAERSPEIRIAFSDEGSHWRLSVTDNGIGLDPKFGDRIFDMFQRLHPESEYPGSGIGLTLCRRIARRHGGDIWVSSIPDVGSTFYVTLRKDQRATQGGADDGSLAPVVSWGGG